MFRNGSSEVSLVAWKLMRQPWMTHPRPLTCRIASVTVRPAMNSWSVRTALILFCLLAFPSISPAPLVFRPGEGWTYERVGDKGGWTRTRAKEQLDVAKEAFDNKDYKLSLKAARRVVKVWPFSDYAPDAQYLVGRSHESLKQDEKAFKEYQKLLEKYPKSTNYEEVLGRQHEIAGRFLAGQWFKLWGYIPFFPSMDKTADMMDKIVKNGPYSEIAPQAQMDIGAAREKQSEYGQAVKAYEIAADRYSDRKEVSADALFKAGLAYHKQARTSEYDQNAAAQAIAAFTDFMTLFPNDTRVPDAQALIDGMRYEQARGNFQIAQFYEKKKRYDGALIYYNEVLAKDPNSSMAILARIRIDDLKRRVADR
jgi:outer membrane protein assembly factor BamD